MKTARGLFRLVFFVFATTGLIAWIGLVTLLKGKNLHRAIRQRQAWANWFLPRIGVRVQVKGQPPDFPCLLMCNHRSYLDPAVLSSNVRAMPVSKSEVARWPIVGYGARISGTLFLQRDNLQSRKNALSEIESAVKNGFSVILFPEGTTHDNASTSPFKKGGFQLAASAQIPVVPVALEYGSVADYWIGNDTFVPHFLQRFGERHMRVQVRYGAPRQDPDMAVWLRETQDWIDAQIPEMRQELN
ncbi:MAG: 1-acyl-sn-glycerol-3-phosphate acyltransferase [Saprospiraceae bacterium]|nr:1-acyl-sn-glycerol-3-phosphate acyltransferase [Saprospiraceae bacterium]